MSNFVAQALSEASASLQELDSLAFAVSHLGTMVRDLHTECYDGTEVFCSKEVA